MCESKNKVTNVLQPLRLKPLSHLTDNVLPRVTGYWSYFDTRNEDN